MLEVFLGDKTVQEKADRHRSRRARAGTAIYEQHTQEHGGMEAMEVCVCVCIKVSNGERGESERCSE